MAEVLRAARLLAWGYASLAVMGCANLQPRVRCQPQAPLVTNAPSHPIQRCEVKL
jgi:hypothetical protein